LHTTTTNSYYGCFSETITRSSAIAERTCDAVVSFNITMPRAQSLLLQCTSIICTYLGPDANFLISRVCL